MRWPWRRRMRDTVTAEPPGEAEVSRQRQREIREQVIGPLDRYAERNQFAELIRQSLTDGHRGKT